MGYHLAELQIAVNTKDLERATTAFDELDKKATSLENRFKKLPSNLPKPPKTTNAGEVDEVDKLTAAQERLIAKVEKLVATVGKSKGEILKYDAALLNVSQKIDPLATKYDQLVIAKKNDDEITKASIKSIQSLDKARYDLIHGLQEQIGLFGKSKLEIAEYRAGLLGVSAQVKPFIEELKRLESVKQQEAKAGVNERINSLSKRERDIALLKIEREEVEAKLRALKETERVQATSITKVQRLDPESLSNAYSPYQPAIAYRQNVERKSSELEKAQKMRELEKAIAPVNEKLERLDHLEKELNRYKGDYGAERFNYLNDQLQETRNKMMGVTKEVDSQEDQFRKLKAAIDPAWAAMDKLEDEQRRLNALKGSVPEADFQRLNTRLQESKRRMQDLANTSGKTQKEINFAMRGLPAQFTDIIVSLQGGQAPLTVLLQQGGQIKDMFGGVGAALKAMGGYVLSLINPFTALAAVVAGVGLVFYDAYTDASQFNEAIFSGKGNFKFTADELKNLALSATSTSNSFGEIAEAMKLLVAQGVTSEKVLVNLSSALAAISDYSGKDVKDLSDDFKDLGKDVEGSLSSIISKYGLIDKESYNAIRAAIDLGDTQKAVDLISETVNENAIQRHKDHYDSLTPIGQAWEDAKKSMLDYYQNLKGNFSKSEEQNLEMMRSGLDYAKRQLNNPSLNKSDLARWQEYITRESEAIIAAERKIREKRWVDDQKSKGQAQVEYQNKLDNEILENRTAVQKKEAEIAALRRNHINQLGKGVVTDEARLRFSTLIKQEEEELSKLREAERKKEERANKPKKVPAYKDSQATKLSIELDKQTAALKAQLGVTETLTKEEKDYKEAVAEVALLQEKASNSKLTAAQKSILAEKESLLLKYKENAELSREIVLQKDRLKSAELLLGVRRAIAATAENDRMRYEDSLMGMSVSGRELQRLQERTALQRDFAKKVSALANNKDYTEADRKTQQAEYEKELADRMDALDNFYREEDRLRGDWVVGMNRSLSEYGDSATDIAGLTANVFTNAFQSMEDSLYNFVMTGKLSFKDFATSVISDMARMATKIASNQLLEGIMNFGISVISGIGTGSGGGVSGASSASGFDFSLGSATQGLKYKPQAAGGAWSNGIQMFANGGAFTNSVVNKPTAFNHAGGLGVMGEAGPEAIMPLTRTSDGQLGVQMVGGGGSSIIAPVTVTVSGVGGNSSVSTSGGDTVNQTKAIQKAIAMETEKAISNALKAGGSIWMVLNSR